VELAGRKKKEERSLETEFERPGLKLLLERQGLSSDARASRRKHGRTRGMGPGQRPLQKKAGGEITR